MESVSVYLRWDCSQCGEKGIVCSPEHRYCPSCKNPRTFASFDQAYLPGDEGSWDDYAHVEIPVLVQKRLDTAGASWFCVVCTSDNYGDESSCHYCETPRGATNRHLRDDTSYKSFQAYFDGDQGATADLVEEFGEYAGMRAAHGESFLMEDAHEGQLARAQHNRSAFAQDMNDPHQSRPQWEDTDLPSSRQWDSQQNKPDLEPEDSDQKYAFEDYPHTRSKIVQAILAMLVLLVVVCVIGFLIWGLSVKQVHAKVLDKHWSHTITVERWTPYQDSDWESNLSVMSEIPPVKGGGERAGIEILSCNLKHHHYRTFVCGRDKVGCRHVRRVKSLSCERERAKKIPCKKTRTKRVACGTKQGSCRTVRKANGTATRTCRRVTKYCIKKERYDSFCKNPTSCQLWSSERIHDFDWQDRTCKESVTRPFCRYESQRWISERSLTKTSKNDEPQWPSFDPKDSQRLSRQASYWLFVQIPEAKVKKMNISRSTYNNLQYGDQVTVSMTNFGTVVDISLDKQ